jgi:hypothetical protein
MNIRSALLCLDCDEIFDATLHKHCPCCTSSQSLAIASYIPSMPLNSIKYHVDSAESMVKPDLKSGLLDRLNSFFWSVL